MERRSVELDFTPLLDITLIVIFFFVIFGRLDADENEARVEAKIGELEAAIEEAEEREECAAELAKQLERELQIVHDFNERQAENMEGVMEYVKGGNVKIILLMQEDGWKVRLNCKDEVVSEIGSDADIGEELIKALQEMGYDAKDTLFCDFVFDGSLPGTASAYRKITKGLDRVVEEFKFLYYSETDLSVGEE